MIRRKLFLLLATLIVFLGVVNSFAFNSVGISTFTASAGMRSIPSIKHMAITGLTQNNTSYYAFIPSTAMAAGVNEPLAFIYINYFTNEQIAYSTATVYYTDANTTLNYVLKYTSPTIQATVTSTTTYKFYYRIIAITGTWEEVALNVYALTNATTGYWPSNGSFYELQFSTPPSVSGSTSTAMAFDPGAPEFSHSPVSFVSGISGLIVATGTVTDPNGLESVDMFYTTDAGTTYSTYTVTPPVGSGAPSKRPASGSYAILRQTSQGNTSYDFRFELNKNTINFAKAKTLSYYLKATNKFSGVSQMPAKGGVYTAQIIAEKTTVLEAATGGNVFLPNGNEADGMTTLVIPAGAMETTTPITIAEVDPADSSVPPGNSPCDTKEAFGVYNFGPENLMFKRPVSMKLLFNDLDHDGVVDGTVYKAAQLKIFWWDGFDWRLLGGRVDQGANLITYNKIKHFSTYAVFPVTNMTDNDYRPKERIITPAFIDGKNDVAMFDGLDDFDVVNIYDVNGKHIRQLRDDFNWDGKDDDGDMVESGIYIYQIKLYATGKIISGVTVVAK